MYRQKFYGCLKYQLFRLKNVYIGMLAVILWIFILHGIFYALVSLHMTEDVFTANSLDVIAASFMFSAMFSFSADFINTSCAGGCSRKTAVISIITSSLIVSAALAVTIIIVEYIKVFVTGNSALWGVGYLCQPTYMMEFYQRFLSNYSYTAATLLFTSMTIFFMKWALFGAVIRMFYFKFGAKTKYIVLGVLLCVFFVFFQVNVNKDPALTAFKNGLFEFITGLGNEKFTVVVTGDWSIDEFIRIMNNAALAHIRLIIIFSASMFLLTVRSAVKPLRIYGE